MSYSIFVTQGDIQYVLSSEFRNDVAMDHSVSLLVQQLQFLEQRLINHVLLTRSPIDSAGPSPQF